MENRAKFGIIHIYRRSVAWEEAGLGIAEEVNSRRVGKNVRSDKPEKGGSGYSHGHEDCCA